MKLTALILLAGCLQLSANSFGQHITLSRKQATLPELFREIHRQAGYFFYYENALMQRAGKVDIAVSDAPIEKVLTICFTNQPFTYLLDGKVIVVQPKSSTSQGQDTSLLTITGKVTNEKGEALNGATVMVEETGQTIVTGDGGGFRLPWILKGSTLLFSNIGYRTERIKALHSRDLVIRLEVSNQKLDEVKIIGYGSTTQRLSTGAVSRVNADVIAQQPVINVLQTLVGRVPGLQINQSNGLPGSPMTVRIRGQHSIAASNNPLYIVDGVPFISQALEVVPGPNADGSTIGNPLNLLNPADIASIEILKDADATAIYGSRAANGVILITTKKGQAGKTNLQMDIQTGIGKVGRFVPLSGMQAYSKFRRDGLANSSLTPDPGNAPDLLIWDSSKVTDWQKWYMGDQVSRTVATASISGGNALTQFLLSGTYHQEGAVLPGSNTFRRTATHLSVGHQSNDKRFQLTSSIYYTTDYKKLSGLTQGILSEIIQAVPNYPIYDAAGKYNWEAGKTNYVALMEAYVKSRTDQLNGNVTLRYTIIPGLDARLNVGYNQATIHQNSAFPTTAKNPAFNETPSASFGNRVNRLYLAEPQLSYKHRISQGTLELLAGGTIQKSESKSQRLFMNNFPNNVLIENINFGTVVNKNGQNTEYRYVSGFGRLNFNWRDKYIVNGNFRRDGSSRFGPGKQFGNFGSIGAAWIFSSEPFFRQLSSAVSFGKLRGSYGTTGNDGIPDYGYIATYRSFTPYGSDNTIVPAQVANADFQWEVNKKLELALELGLFNNRVLLTSAWYRNRSTNQLVGYPLPAMTGFTSYQANLPALVQNSGWEFDFSSTNIRSSKLEWSTTFNVTIPRNELVSFPNLASTAYANQFVEGHSLSIVQLFQLTGIDANTGLPGVADINKDGSIIQSSSYNGKGGDLVIAGQTNPRWTGGLGNSLKIGRLQLDLFFQWVSQDGYNLKQSYGQFGRLFNMPAEFLDYWQTPGQTGVSPKPMAQFTNSLYDYASSDAAFGEASFLRLKNVSVAMDCKTSWMGKAKISSLILYLQGQNLFTITGYKGFDPETAGGLRLMVPSLRMVTAGIKCSF